MMNSMNSFIESIESRFDVIQTTIVTPTQVAFDLKNNDVHSLMAHLKSQGWKQMSFLTCVDWIEENQFELVYVVFNWDQPIYVQVRTRVDREKPLFRTMTPVFPGAKYYERDVHEFFGVEFEGNPDSNKQLFLENWDDIPPLRKDFDSKAYSDKKYVKREYTKTFENKAKGENE